MLRAAIAVWAVCFAFASPAYAGCDDDGDGYEKALPGCTWVGVSADCDDNDATVHPGQQEVPRNGVDDDCDGHDKVFRVISEDFSDLADWGDSEGASPPEGDIDLDGDAVILDPGYHPVAGWLDSWLFWIDTMWVGSQSPTQSEGGATSDAGGHGSAAFASTNQSTAAMPGPSQVSSMSVIVKGAVPAPDRSTT